MRTVTEYKIVVTGLIGVHSTNYNIIKISVKPLDTNQHNYVCGRSCLFRLWYQAVLLVYIITENLLDYR